MPMGVLRSGKRQKANFTAGAASILGIPSASYMPEMVPGSNSVPTVWEKTPDHVHLYMNFLVEDYLRCSSKVFFFFFEI
jgi:hypothetical protein